MPINLAAPFPILGFRVWFIFYTKKSNRFWYRFFDKDFMAIQDWSNVSFLVTVGSFLTLNSMTVKAYVNDYKLVLSI